MSDPYVTKVTYINGQIVLTVQLDEYLANESVEISGYATQNSGGFATFYDVQSVGAAPDGTVTAFVTAVPSAPFNNGERVTVSLRAARVWVAVLAQSQGGQELVPDGTPAADGATWGSVKEVGWVSAGAWSAGQAGPNPGGGAKFPPGK